MTADRVVVEADGGSRGNPGPAGYGAVVKDADSGAVLAERSESIGTATNNVAEYNGLIAGLSAAADLGAAQVAVRMDSKLVVEQMSGRWQVKHPDMRPLARQANELRRCFEHITFTWIPREQNKHADRLANEAMDAAAGISRTRRQPPTERPDSPEPAMPQRPPTAELARRVRAAAYLRGEFTLRSGQTSDEYFDKYLVEADPALLADAAGAMAELVPPGERILAGLEMGGIPLVTMLGQLTKAPIRFVRRQAKEYGTGQLVEGGPVDGAVLVLVEDVITTGGAVLTAVDAVRAAGAVVDTVVCFIDRQQGGREALAGKGVAVRAVLTAEDLRRSTALN